VCEGDVEAAAIDNVKPVEIVSVTELTEQRDRLMKGLLACNRARTTASGDLVRQSIQIKGLEGRIDALQKDRDKALDRLDVVARRRDDLLEQRDTLKNKLARMTTARDAVFAELRATRDGHTVIHAATGNRYDVLYQQALIVNMAALVGDGELELGACIDVAARAAYLTVRKIMDHADEGSDNS
jgi:hypothetical protein